MEEKRILGFWVEHPLGEEGWALIACFLSCFVLLKDMLCWESKVGKCSFV